MILLLVFMQLTRDLFAIAKFLLSYAADKQTYKQTKPNILPTLWDHSFLSYAADNRQTDKLVKALYKFVFVFSAVVFYYYT